MSNYKSVKDLKNHNSLIRLVSDICMFAIHNNDDYWENPQDYEGFDLEQSMRSVSFVCACYVSQFFDTGIESDLFLHHILLENTKDEDVIKFVEGLVNELSLNLGGVQGNYKY